MACQECQDRKVHREKKEQNARLVTGERKVLWDQKEREATKGFTGRVARQE